MVNRAIIALIPLILLAALLPAGSLADPPPWDHIEPGSPEAAALERSQTLPAPLDTLVTPDEIRALAQTALAARPGPDTHAIRLLVRDRTAFDTDGYYHLIQQEAVLVLTRKGCDTYGTVSASYDLPYDRTRILEAYVIAPDGTITSIPQEDILDESNSEDAYVNIFEPIWRSKIINFPGLEPGAIISYTYENCAISTRSPGALHWGHGFNGTDPILEASCRLRAPAQLNLHWAVVNDPDERVEFSREPGETWTDWTWTGRNLPVILEEPGMVHIEEVRTSLLVSTETWEEFSRRESVLIEPFLVPDDAIRAKVAELTDGLADPESKMAALFRYVTRSVRYLGVTYGDRPGVNPDPVTRTFANNAGVCKDKAGLLTAMLRIIGIDAYYTLNNPERRVFGEAAVDQFNHAIVSVKLPGSDSFRYLDVTTDLEKDMLPATSGGTGVLRISKEGHPFDRIPVSPPDRNAGTITAESTIDAQGNLTGTIRFEGIGQVDSSFRSALYYIPEAEHDQWFNMLLQAVSPGAVLDGIDIAPESMDDLTIPLTFTLRYHAPDFLVRLGGSYLFKVPSSRNFLDDQFERVVECASRSLRHWPADLGSTWQMTVSETVRLPRGMTVQSLPKPVNVSRANLEFSRTHAEGPDQAIRFEQTFVCRSPRVQAEEFEAFRSAVSDMRVEDKAFVILQKKGR